ncbi:phenylacetate--CoA ligase family protein [Fibrobacterota bacterium]
MNTWAARNIYRCIQWIRREPAVEKLRELNRSQWQSSRDLENLQFRKMKRILAHAYENISFYRNRFDSCGFSPDSFSDKRQLSVIPCLTKEEVQKNGPELSDKAFKGLWGIESTSGSTGNPMKFKVDREFAAGFRAEMYRAHLWAGLEVGEREARFYGIPMNRYSNARERVKDVLMNRKRFSVFDLSDSALARYWQAINSFRPRYLYGYASGLYRFAEFMTRKNLKPSFELAAVISTAEVLHPHEKEMMEEAWGTRVYNEYGCSELGILASECPEGSMHMNCENNYVEIVSDKQSVTGKQGEIVVTNLNNHVMPFIRYRTGDVGSMKAGNCVCGRSLPVMDLVEGRLSSMVLTPEGKVVSGWVFYYMFRDLLESHTSPVQLRIIQRAVDHMHFLVENRKKTEANMEDLLNRRCREYLGPRMKATFEYVDRLPVAPSGKLLHFVSELDLDIAGTQYKTKPS